MTIARNDIIEALRARLEDGLQGVNVTRGTREPQPEDMPELQVGAITEQANEENTGTKPGVWRLRVSCLLWFRTSEEGGPVPPMLAMLDQIEAALKLQPDEEGGYWTTLGGRVYGARFAGVDTMPDTQQQDQARALVTVDVLVRPVR
jgi:hypothetical protein